MHSYVFFLNLRCLQFPHSFCPIKHYHCLLQSLKPFNLQFLLLYYHRIILSCPEAILLLALHRPSLLTLIGQNIQESLHPYLIGGGFALLSLYSAILFMTSLSVVRKLWLLTFIQQTSHWELIWHTIKHSFLYCSLSGWLGQSIPIQIVTVDLSKLVVWTN
jgi:hypothetical protein